MIAGAACTSICSRTSARGIEAFTRADANKDNTVTIAELQALPAGPR